MVDHVQAGQWEMRRDFEIISRMVSAKYMWVVVIELKAPRLGNHGAIVAIVVGALVHQRPGPAFAPGLALEPHLHCDFACQVEACAIRNQNVTVAIEAEALPDFAGCKGDAVEHLSVVRARRIRGIAFSSPPRNQAGS